VRACVLLIPLLIGCGSSTPVIRQDGPPSVLSEEAKAVRLGTPGPSCRELGRVEGRDGYGRGGADFRDGTRDGAEAALKTAVATLHGNLVQVDHTEAPSDRWINGTSMVHFPYMTLSGMAFQCQ
jgi:hypothetical protein